MSSLLVRIFFPTSSGQPTLDVYGFYLFMSWLDLSALTI